MNLNTAQLRALQQALGYEFTNTSLLSLALSHRSVGSNNNERLEFLGDSLVNHVVAEALYKRYPTAPEGEMSRRRAHLVKGETLAAIAREKAVGDCLALGQGERKSGGHRRKSILADALEALAAAILLDSDFETAKAVVYEWFRERLTDEASFAANKDAKTSLQEWLQARGLALPEYHLVATRGEDHQKVFVVECHVPSKGLKETASASSRRRAEQASAQQVLGRLR